MNRMMAALVLVAAPAMTGFSVPAATAQAADTALVGEARAFMEAYQADLIAGDREAIAARYDPNGAFIMGGGLKNFAPHTEIERRYVEEWSPPSAFGWRDLSYDQAGPDTVIVAGLFDWTWPDAAPETWSYSAVLIRRDGKLRIRLEHEDPMPPPADMMTK